MFRRFAQYGVLGILFLAGVAYAEETEVSQRVVEDRAGVKLGVGPGITVVDMNAGVGLNVEVGGRVSFLNPMFFSLLLNVSRWAPSMITGYQAIPCFTYHFERTRKDLAHFYLGAGAGIAGFDRGYFGLSGHPHSVFMIRPGIEFAGLADEDGAIAVEARFALIEKTFAIMPQMTWSMSF